MTNIVYTYCKCTYDKHFKDDNFEDKCNLRTMGQHVAHLLVIMEVIGSNLGQTLRYN